MSAYFSFQGASTFLPWYLLLPAKVLLHLFRPLEEKILTVVHHIPVEESQANEADSGHKQGTGSITSRTTSSIATDMQ